MRDARHLAVDRGLSLSAFLAAILRAQVESTRRYEAARERNLEVLRKGLPLGTNGRISWTRDSLHDR
ncbi:MAG TPA: CopG family transcriptional regulator [Dehalococcoidia bacterium]|nr:CopG family transcriptional regulator [Dehalococcoidia bacterium]